MQLRKTFYYAFMLSVIACIGMSVGVVFAQDNALNGGTLRGQSADTTKLQHQDQQAVARYIAAWMGQELILTEDQRKNLEQSLLDATANESFLVSMRLFEIDILIDILEALHLINEKLEISLDELLTLNQFYLLQGIVTKKMGKGNKVQVEIQLRSFAIAKLRAHADLLGPLDKEASRRLSAIEGVVVQQYIDAQNTDPEATYRETATKLRQAVEAGEMTDKQVDERLDALMKELWDENGVIRWREPNGDITRNPLFQKTIKDVLSEEAFAQYTAHQAERDKWHQQALRDVAVASLGMPLVLNDTQRKQLKAIAAELTVDPLKTDALSMFYQLLQRTDREMLSPWQKERLTSMQAGFERQFRE